MKVVFKLEMRDSKQILVKEILGSGHLQDNALTSFFTDSKSSILGLSNEISLISEFFLEGG